MNKALEPARGIRNNSPGNIRFNRRNKWLGLASPAYDEQGFCRFVHAKYGIRAIARILLAYDERGINTVRHIIGTWAPPTENNTQAYVLHVASAMAVDPDGYLNVDSIAVMRPLVETIIRHENGRQPYSRAVIDEGLYLAGVSDAKKPKLLGLV